MALVTQAQRDLCEMVAEMDTCEPQEIGPLAKRIEEQRSMIADFAADSHAHYFMRSCGC